VANWNVDEDLLEGNAIIQSYRKTVTDTAFSWIMIIQSDLRILDTIHPVAESVDSRVRSNIIFVILGRQSSINQRDGDLPLERDAKVIPCIGCSDLGQRGYEEDPSYR